MVLSSIIIEGTLRQVPQSGLNGDLVREQIRYDGFGNDVCYTCSATECRGQSSFIHLCMLQLSPGLSAHTCSRLKEYGLLILDVCIIS